ncbi:MAG TPA: adenine phosphoribosyltransferase [Oscillatoriaceae cyanobacterium]
MTLPTAKLNLADFIRDIPDFPQPGILFKDVTPLMREPAALRATIDRLAEQLADLDFDHLVGIESRGFIFGAPLAYKLGKGFVPIRKPGKLPYHTERIDYTLEYGSGSLEVHADALEAGHRAVIIDDLLATGGTVCATRELLGRLGAEVVAAAFVVELGFLNGREKLPGLSVRSLLTY